MNYLLIAALALTPLLAESNHSTKRLHEAASVLSEVMDAPDKGIPADLLSEAHCVVIVPDLKTAAFVVGGKFGNGYMSCRRTSGWGCSDGSVGFQLGGSSTDLIMLVMTKTGC